MIFYEFENGAFRLDHVSFVGIVVSEGMYYPYVPLMGSDTRIYFTETSHSKRTAQTEISKLMCILQKCDTSQGLTGPK